MNPSQNGKGKENQIVRGIHIGCVTYLILFVGVIPFFFAFAPVPDVPLIGGHPGVRPILDLYIYFALPFIIAFMIGIGIAYRKLRHTKPVLAKSLLITTSIVAGLSVLVMGILAYNVYT